VMPSLISVESPLTMTFMQTSINGKSRGSGL
jgi:hypothetical protein